MLAGSPARLPGLPSRCWLGAVISWESGASAKLTWLLAEFSCRTEVPGSLLPGGWGPSEQQKATLRSLPCGPLTALQLPSSKPAENSLQSVPSHDPRKPHSVPFPGPAHTQGRGWTGVHATGQQLWGLPWNAACHRQVTGSYSREMLWEEPPARLSSGERERQGVGPRGDVAALN